MNETPLTTQEQQPSTSDKETNPYKAVTIIVSALLAIVAAAGLYLFSSGIIKLDDGAPVNSSVYSIDLSVDAITNSAPVSQMDTKALDINDVSDSFADKFLTIGEWDLKIATKYADLLEYEHTQRPASWGQDGSPYSACNGDYVHCDSVLAVRIKEQYVDLSNDAGKGSASYAEASDGVKKEMRTVAYIFQDNRSLSQSGSTKVRYWSAEVFRTEFGTTASLLFEQQAPGGIDEVGNAYCGVDLTVSLASETPCEDIFASVYRFDASKP